MRETVRRRVWLSGWGMVALGAGLVVGVMRSPAEQPVAIQSILDSPVLDTSVYLEGTVGDRVPLVDAQVYQLQDETGTIWVLTSEPEIPTGEAIEIQGIVRFLGDGDPQAQSELLYIEEQERR